MVRDLRRVTLARFVCGALGGVVLPALGVLLIAPRVPADAGPALAVLTVAIFAAVARGRALRALPVLLGGAVVEDAGRARLMRRNRLAALRTGASQILRQWSGRSRAIWC